LVKFSNKFYEIVQNAFVFVILKYEFFIRQKYLNEKITLLNLVKLKLLLPISSNFIQSYSYTMERVSAQYSNSQQQQQHQQQQ
jgi:hypothetical protein